MIDVNGMCLESFNATSKERARCKGVRKWQRRGQGEEEGGKGRYWSDMRMVHQTWCSLAGTNRPELTWTDEDWPYTALRILYTSPGDLPFCLSLGLCIYIRDQGSESVRGGDVDEWSICIAR